MINRASAGLCAVCARRECGIGIYVNPRQSRSPIMWICDDPDCLEIAKETKAMKQDKFDRFESLAAGKGGAEAGAFLEQIGKTDMATLTPDEWFEFCRRMVAGYRKGLKQLLGVDGK